MWRPNPIEPNQAENHNDDDIITAQVTQRILREIEYLEMVELNAAKLAVDRRHGRCYVRQDADKCWTLTPSIITYSSGIIDGRYSCTASQCVRQCLTHNVVR